VSPRFLLDHFDLLAEAPGGIARLRELVLHLAVRGKLVPQDPADEPASELLKRIAKERARLVKEGKIRAGKTLPPVGTDEAPFEVPEGWVWVRIEEVCTLVNGRAFKPSDWTARGIPIVRIQNLNNPESLYNYFDKPVLEKFYVHPGDLLFAWSGTPGTSFGAHIWEGRRAILNQHIFRVIIDPSHIDRHYFKNCLNQALSTFISKAHGGAGLKHITKGKFEETSIPLPPLAEQHRIVARVEELMALLDRLEAARGERDTTRLAARDSALAALRDAADASEVAAAWRRLEARLDDLFQAPEDVPPLRQAILQLAVRGRLVAQDPADEPASELLGAGLIPPETRSGVPWPAPPNWAWSSLRNLGTFVGGGTPSKNNPSLWNGNIPWVSPKDMKTALITDSQDHIAKQALSESAVKLVPVGSILMVVRGMILAHSFPTARTAVRVTINQDMKAIVPHKKTITDYLQLLLQASVPRVLGLVERSTHGTCKLPFDNLVDLPIPLPPLAEQHRIVARVDALMVLCDRLESRLAAAREAQTALAAALLHQVTQPDFAA